MEELEGMKERAKESSEEASQLRERLAEKGDLLKELQLERNKHILDAYDMKYVVPYFCNINLQIIFLLSYLWLAFNNFLMKIL